MFSKLKSGDNVYVGYGKRGIEGYHYQLCKVKRVTPKKNLLLVEGFGHFHQSDGTCTSWESSRHLELATSEFQEALRQKNYVTHTKYRMLGCDTLTYDQAVKINQLLDELDINMGAKL